MTGKIDMNEANDIFNDPQLKNLHKEISNLTVTWESIEKDFISSEQMLRRQLIGWSENARLGGKLVTNRVIGLLIFGAILFFVLSYLLKDAIISGFFLNLSTDFIGSLLIFL